jgi:hypothetical protein
MIFQEYEGYTNFPLDPQVQIYHLMSRAFVRDDKRIAADHSVFFLLKLFL